MKSEPTNRTHASILFTTLLCAILTVPAQATVFFTEEFNGTTLDPAWSALGDAGHTGLNGSGAYVLTDPHGNPGTELRRDPLDGPSSFRASVVVAADPFNSAPSLADPSSNNTRSDFKWRFFGPNGFAEVILNSFGDMRLFHRDNRAGAGGNLAGNTNIGIADGDSLELMLSYSQAADTMDLSYSLNGDAAVPFYSGAGNGDGFGDFASNFMDVQVFKWGASPADQAVIAIDRWSVVPEPSSVGMLSVGALGLLFGRRRKAAGTVA